MITTIEILNGAIKEAEELVGVTVDEQSIVVRQKAVEILSESIDDPELAAAKDRESKNLLAGCRIACAILNFRIASEQAAA